MVTQTEDAKNAVAYAVRKARELSSALSELDRLGVRYEVEIETLPIPGRTPLRQITVYVATETG